MADIFQHSDVKRLLYDKYVVFLGDSNCRALYKDLIWLLNSNSLIEDHVLRRKLEFSYLGDELIERSELTKGRDFQEVRLFERDGFRVLFHFLTRCYNKHLENLITSCATGRAPDVIYMSSCLWDLSRWGPQGVTAYKDNIIRVMKLFKKFLPPSTLVVWGTALPISKAIRSGLLVKQIEFLKHTLRFEVMEANMFARQIVVNFGYDVLDLHYHMRMQIHRRAGDGVHYVSLPVRLMTNLLLTHVALAWGCELPGNISNSLLDKAVKNSRSKEIERLDEKIPLVLEQIGDIADRLQTETNMERKKKKKKNHNNYWHKQRNNKNDNFYENNNCNNSNQYYKRGGGRRLRSGRLIPY